jgi:predicted RNA-binding Zn-ribbon protein involved in translation (DUF1610 family)
VSVWYFALNKVKEAETDTLCYLLRYSSIYDNGGCLLINMGKCTVKVGCFLGLPSGFQLIRHYGLIANTTCKKNLTKIKGLLNVKEPEITTTTELVEDKSLLPAKSIVFTCPECSEPMIIKDILICRLKPRAPPIKLVN